MSVPNLPAVNFRITPDLRLGKGGEVEKFNDNLAAIRALKAVESERRRSTPAEQRLLARYVGWGGLANAFENRETKKYKAGWETRGAELAELLTDKELQLARRSTLDAHYTAPEVVSAMWTAARRLGFKGGSVLENSMGTGNFLGLMPDELVSSTRFVGVEYDSITARIATLLYPQETVLNAGFQKVPLSDGSFELNIGNVPFGDQSLRFQFKPGLAGASIHNQFLRASLDALKPGGLQVQVVTRYLMDQINKGDRIALAKKAKLLGAIRLPDTAFKENARTEVVTDILFFQRLTVSQESQMAEAFAAANAQPDKNRNKEFDRQRLAALVPEWVGTRKIRDPLGGDPMVVNNYFIANTHMILGTLERSGSMQYGNDITVRMSKADTLPDLLTRAIDRLPQDVMQQEPDAIEQSLLRFNSMSDALRIALAGHEAGAIAIDPDGKMHQVVERQTPSGEFELAQRELTAASAWSETLLQTIEGGWYTITVPKGVDGKPLKVADKDGKPTKRNATVRIDYGSEQDIPATMLLGPARFERLKKLVGLRDLFVKQITLETEDAPPFKMEGNRKLLAAAHKAFTDAHGWVSDPSNSKLVDDMPDGALVQALENDYLPEITPARSKSLRQPVRPAIAKPAPILSRRMIHKYEPPGTASSAADALQITLSEFGRINLERMATLLDKTEAAVVAELHDDMDSPLIFKDPETGTWETAALYLSGQVRRKLIAAQSAGAQKNVKALEAVQPELWGAENVTALVGSTWVPPAIYADFFVHMTGVLPRVSFSELTNSYAVRMPTASKPSLNEEWGSDGMRVETIIGKMLNTEPVKVFDSTDEGPRLNIELTKLAQLKATQISAEFDNWVFADGTRRDALVAIFNEKFNTRVQRQHDGAHLVLPGKVPDVIIRMRRHQKNAIWRGISERFTLYDHVVGSGKTYTAIARAMERRRMGLTKKAMIVVPNHMVAEWTNSVYRLYPGANVLALGKTDLSKKRRRKVFAKIAAGDQDIVIVPHSSFGFIGIAQETEERYLEVELVAAETAIKEAWEASEEAPGSFRKPHTVKQAERLRDKMQARMDRIRGRDKADRLLTFEQLGVDDLTVDEAHEFKNLFYSSRLTDVRGMGNAAGSQKAFDLYSKVRVLQESPTGSVTFMTGTPISNSAVEMYNMMRYLAPAELKGLGLEHFDAFRAQFVSTNPGWEPDPTGRLKEVNRLGRTWSNMRSLMDLYYSFTDSVDNDAIKLAFAEDNFGAEFPIPKVKGGDRKEVVVQPTPAQSTELADVMEGFDALPNITDPYDRNIARLRLWDRARKVSLDVRAAQPSSNSDEKGGKLDRLSDEVARIHKDWTPDRGTQLVFLDRSVPRTRGDDKVIKDYDAKVATRDAALAAKDEDAYRAALDALSEVDPNEMEALRAAQAGGWNAYQQIKDNLVARGIPADEIRFIQEATNDAQKQALFDAVNGGTVRVLIGSTQRMGAGTNVQRRLVGLHHADVTWKPSDIEQREGRIIRQGNWFATPPELSPGGVNPLYRSDFEVEILAYATERTIDSTMWSLNSSKLRTINGIRKYDGAFSMEFDDEESVSMAHLAALASGDPKLMERVKLSSEIDKLELLERAHRRKNYGVESSIEQAERDIKNLPHQIEKTQVVAEETRAARDALLARVAARRVTVEGQVFDRVVDAVGAAEAAIKVQQAGKDTARYSLTVDGKKHTNKEGYLTAIHAAFGDVTPFEAVINGVTYTSRTDAQRELANIAHKAAVEATDAATPIELGTFAGLKFEADLNKYKSLIKGVDFEYQLELTVISATGATITSSSTNRSVDTDFSTAGLAIPVRALNVDPTGYDTHIDYMRRKLANAQADLPALLPRRNERFPQQAELDAKRKRLEVVTHELAHGPAVVVDEPNVSTNLTQTGRFEANETDVLFDIQRKSKPSLATQLRERGVVPESRMDAERRFDAGDRVFVWHEQDETPREVKGVTELEAFTPDQMLVLPTERKEHRLGRLGAQMAQQGYERADVPRVQAARAMRKLIDEFEAGTVDDGAFIMRTKVLADRMATVADTKAANRLMSGRVRDVDHVRAELLKARRRGDLDHATVEFALWALDKNPALAANLAISIRKPGEGTPAGDYNPAAEIIRLFKVDGDAGETAVHEILHHAERMMPEDMQGAIRKEWSRALADAIKKGTPEQVAALKDIALAAVGNQVAHQAVVDAIQQGPLNYTEHYQLINPSEYWAVNGARILGQHHAAKDSVWQRIRQWLRELVQKVRALVGLPSTAAVIRSLHYVTDASHFGVERGGRFESGAMLSDKQAVAAMQDLRRDPPQTPGFKHWFKGSKVVNAAGAPKVMYHATTIGTNPRNGQSIGDIEAFDRFATKRIFGRESLDQVGSWFSDGASDESGAGRYAGGAIYAVYLSIKKPWSVTFAGMSRMAQKLSGQPLDSRPNAKSVAALDAWMDERDIDGIHIIDDTGAKNGSTEFRDQDVWVARRPEQIKSAIGNSGAFDRTNPSILQDIARSAAPATTPAPAAPRKPWLARQAETTPAIRPWLDPLNRPQFAPGAWVAWKLGDLAGPLLARIGLKPMSTALSHQLRAMKLQVQKAQETAAGVSEHMTAFTEGERNMVSDIIEQELAAGVTPPSHTVRMAALMSSVLTTQTRELVDLGMLSEASASRWDGKYLPRFYSSKLRKELGDAWSDAVRRLTGRTSVMKGIRGNHLKMRGLPKTIDVAELDDFVALGWEVRDPGYVDGESKQVQVWRDWTREERDARGEIRDAGFRFVMGYMQTQRDLALGRMFAGMAADPAQSARLKPDGVDWVLVPNTHVDGTGVNRYGKLAGRYVPRETLSHLSQIEEADSAAWRLYRKGMGIWKEGKTALNPASHMNNTVGNTIMAHIAGVSFHRPDKYVAAAKDMIWKAPMVKEAHDAGLFLGGFNAVELLDALPPELKTLVAKADSRTVAGAKVAYNALTLGLRKPLGALYGAEDTFFRYLLYKDARSRGVAPNEAVDHAQRFIFTYDDLPGGARKIRDFGIPFFAYTYKAIPVLANELVTHPVRFGTAASLIWVANAAAYALALGDDDDEWHEKLRRYATDADFRAKVKAMEAAEQENLPPWQRGMTAMFTRKVIRLGTDSVTKLPLFIDVARMIPGNDLADVTPHVPGAAWLPQPLTPSHPVFSLAVGMMANTDLWTGKPLVDTNDTFSESGAKRTDWIWKLVAPAVAPGGANWDRAMDALAQANGGEVPWVPKFISQDRTGIDKGGLPVQPGYAALQTIGIKVRPQDLEKSERIDNAMQAKLVREIIAELRKDKRLANVGAIKSEVFERRREAAKLKIERVREGQTVDGTERR